MEGLFSELHTRQTAQNTETTPSSTTQTDGLVGDLIWKNSLQQRTTTVVTISFNLFATLLIIASILFDAKKAWKQSRALQASYKTKSPWSFHPAETFPLVISTAIAVQATIFLGIQCTGLDSPLSDQCRVISQIAWPAFWIVAYTLLVFGVEVAFRGFQKKRFHSRGKYTVPICWSIVLTMLIATWVPSHVYKNPRNDCDASLTSWVMPWADIALFLNSIIVFLYLLTGFMIAYQLSRTAKIDRNERIAASRIVYYLAIGVVLMSGVLPFWACVVLRKPTDNAARIATVALNIFGLLTGVLYLILRSNSHNMAFRPNTASWEQKQEWRLFGSPDLDIGKHVTNPVGLEHSGNLHEVVLPSTEKSKFEARTVTSRTLSDPATAKELRSVSSSPPSYRTPSKSTISRPPFSSPPSYRAPPVLSASDPLLISPPASQVAPQMLHSETRSQSFNQASYNLFPQQPASIPVIAINQPDTPSKKPPVPPAPLFFNRHKRDTSNISSATVQIGMRLSTVAVESEIAGRMNRTVTYPPVTDNPKSNPWRNPSQFTQRSLDGAVGSLDPPIEMKNRLRDSSPHEILFRLNSNEELAQEAVHISAPLWPKPLEDLVSPTRRISSWRKFRDKRMKSLPPVPVTPSIMEPTSSYRASFPEPHTPASSNFAVRASQERIALSLALKEDEQWPLHGVDMVALPNRPYIPDENRSWI